MQNEETQSTATPMGPSGQTEASLSSNPPMGATLSANSSSFSWPLAGGRGVSSFWLKLVAIVAMTCDHAGLIFYPHLPFEAQCVLIGLGGITFPVMAFLLVEGYIHTSDIRRYGMRLAVFALVSEAPFWLFLGHKGNVLFTLLIGLVLLWAYDHVSDSLLRIVVAGVLLWVSAFCDWGIIGPAVVLLFYRGRGSRFGTILAVLLPLVFGALGVGPALAKGVAESANGANLPYLLYYVFGNTAVIPLVFSYNGTRGRHPLKWFFYLYYPLHIAVLGIIHFLVFGNMPALMV